jgi:cytochrome c biogenesis protein CcmG/thiol:disulfide interchange protein DsbE
MARKTSGNPLSRRERLALRRRQKWMRTLMLLAGGLLVVAALVIGFTRNGSASLAPAQIGQPLGNFTLQNLDGAPVSLADYSGRMVLINAWATWCPPCRAEMPALNDYYQAHKNQGFVILAINAGDAQSQAAAFAQQLGLAFPVLLDPDTRLLDSLGIHSFPTSILLGRDGRVKAIHVGMFSPQELDAEVTPLLAQ